MNGNGNILARLRRRKARGALYAAVLFVASQLSAALTPCFASPVERDPHPQADHAVSAATPHGDDAGHDAHYADHADHAHHAHHALHSSDTSHSSHANETTRVDHASHAADPDDRRHCPHCAGGAPDGGDAYAAHVAQLAHVGQAHACTAVDTVDTAPQALPDHGSKLFYSPAILLDIDRPDYAAARASPRRDAPRLPSAVPLNVRHCVFLI